MALRTSALGCTHIAAHDRSLSEGKTRRENRESKTMVVGCDRKNNGKYDVPTRTLQAKLTTWDVPTTSLPSFARRTAEGGCPHIGSYLSYSPPSFSKNKQIVSIPWWKFGMWNFSLGACRLSSGRPKPIITLGIFSAA